MAVRLASKGISGPSGRIRVGAVVVSGGRAVGYGHSTVFGPPAVLMALEDAGPLAEDATLYTNTDPCQDSGRPEDYLPRLLELRPGRVVIGHRSSVPADASSGILARLESSGIAVESGVCEDECLEINEVYFKYRRTGLPFVTVKFAATLDGRIATSTGDSRWVSSRPSLRFAHELRREHDAVLVGIGTVLADDPQLTVRLVSGRNPIRVIVDSSLRIPATARVLSIAESRPVIIATTDRADLSRVPTLEGLGAEVVVLPSVLRPASPVPAEGGSSHAVKADPEHYGVDLTRLLARLGERQIASLLVEGGSEIITSVLGGRSADRVVAIIAPKIIGRGVEAIGDLGIKQLRGAITFRSIKTRRVGSDIVFDGRILAAVDKASEPLSS